VVKKYVVYDKNGKVVIITSNKRIAEYYGTTVLDDWKILPR
jgi:hypothetical protein